MIWRWEVIFPTLFLSYFSDILTMIVTSVSNIPVYFGMPFSVCKIFMCYIHVIVYCKEDASVVLSSTNPSLLPSFLPSLVSVVDRSIRIQSLFYYLFKIISSLKRYLKHAYRYLNRC